MARGETWRGDTVSFHPLSARGPAADGSSKKKKAKKADKGKREKENFFAGFKKMGGVVATAGVENEGVVDDEIFSNLLSMGFNEELCRKMAIKHRGNCDGAINEMLNNGSAG